jgi:hypothetical protein
MRQAPVQNAIVLLLMSATLPASAMNFKPIDDVDMSLVGTVTFGTMIRTANPDPNVVSRIPSSVVPDATPGNLVGQTGGSDLNFKEGKPVSTVLKALLDFDVHGRNIGLFARADAWHDFTLGHADAPYGNYPNGYTPNTPLSDRGFAREARFDGAEFRDAYVYGNLEPTAQSRVDMRLGRQVLNWGFAQFLAGGISSGINPVDLASQVRPGSLPQEARLPVAMLDMKLSVDRQWGVEAFVPFESRQNVLPGCGTFFDLASLVPHGCLVAGALSSPIAGTPISTVSSLTENSLLSNGYYVHRLDDVNARRGGQFGLATRYTAASLDTEFSAYAMDTSSSAPYFRMTVEDVNGATLPAGLGGGLARLTSPTGLKYATVFPEHVHLYGAGFDTHLDTSARFYGEVAYRPDQPLGMNPNDILTAFLLRSPTSLLQLHSDILAVPAGGTWDAYDRYGVINSILGGSKTAADMLGADRVVVSGEVGDSRIPALPDTMVMRYGRGLAYGTAPYMLNGSLTACSEAVPGFSGVPGKTCTGRGFITKDSWGLRGRIAATYANSLLGAALTPSLLVGLDMGGYSYDGTYSQGRTTIRAGLRADWGTRWYVDAQLTQYGGGSYNLMADRGNLMVAAGARF